MSGIVNATPPSSQIFCSDAPQDLDLNKEECEQVESHPALKQGFGKQATLLKLLKSPVTEQNCLQLIAEASVYVANWVSHKNDTNVKRACADYMARRLRRGEPALIRTYMKECLKSAGQDSFFDDWTEPSWIKDVITYLLRLTNNWSDASDLFRLAVCQSEFVADLLSGVQYVTERVNRKDRQVSLYDDISFKRTVSTLYNCSKHPDTATSLEAADALRVLHPVRRTKSKEIKWMISTTMCNIVRDKREVPVLADKDSLDFILDMLRQSMVCNNPRPEAYSFNYSKLELAEAVESITRRQENWTLAIGCGLLPCLELLLEVADHDIQVVVCRILTQMSLSYDIREQIREMGIKTLLNQMCQSSIQDGRNAAETALKAVKEE